MSMSVPGESCRSSKCCTPPTTGCQFRLPGECVYYSGTSLSTTGINPGDTINVIVTKLNNFVSLIPAIAANNGLSVSGSTVQLGQTVSQAGNPANLLSNREIPTAGFSLLFTGTGRVAIGTSTPNSTHKFTSVATSTDRAINATSIDGICINSTSSGSGHAIFGQAQGTGNSVYGAHVGSSGYGVLGTASIGGTPFRARKFDSGNTNNATPIVAEFVRDNSGLGTDGNGFSIMLRNQTTTTTEVESGQIRNYWSTISHSSRTSVLEFYLINNAVSTQVLTIQGAGNGRIGIGSTVTSPTARLNLPAGTAAANTAPLKFTSGTLLTTAEAGAMEFLTDKIYMTITTGASRKEIALVDSTLSNRTIVMSDSSGRLVNSLLSQNAAANTVTINASNGVLSTSFTALNSISSPTLTTIFGSSGIQYTGSANFTISTGGTSSLIVSFPKMFLGSSTTPTATLHIKASTGAANTVPIKLIAGTNVATPEDGSIEYDGTNLYFTIGSTRSAFVLGATAGATIYTGDGTVGGNRTINMNSFSATWTNTNLFRIVNGDATIGGAYDFNTGVNLLSYDASNSSNLILDPVTGLTFEYTDLSGPTVKSSLAVDNLGVKLTGIQEFTDNAAAITGGLTAGYLYRTGDTLKIVH